MYHQSELYEIESHEDSHLILDDTARRNNQETEEQFTISSSIISPRYNLSSRRNSNEEDDGNSTKLYDSHDDKSSIRKVKCIPSTLNPDQTPIKESFSMFLNRNTAIGISNTNNWTKSLLRRRYWCLVVLFILVAIMFLVMGLWILLKLSKKDERTLVDKIFKKQRESMLVSKKILLNGEILERLRKRQLIVKEHTVSLNAYLLENWVKLIEFKTPISNSVDTLDLIVFRTVNGEKKPINRKKLNQFISEKINTQKIRVHIVDHKSRDLNLQTVNSLMESHTNSWLIISNDNLNFQLIPSMMYPYDHLVGNELFDWVDSLEFEKLQNLQSIPITWKERFEKSTEFWSTILTEMIGKQVVDHIEPPTHVADMENIVKKSRFDSLLEMEESSEFEVINQFSRFNIIKSLEECNILSWVLPENMEEIEKTKLEESITLFLYRFRRVLQKSFSLLVTNDKTIYNRAAIFMPQVLLMEEKRSAIIAANLHCLTRKNTQFASRLSGKALPEMSFSKAIKKNNIEFIQYFATNPKPIKLKVAIQVEDSHIYLKRMETTVKELAQYLSDNNIQVTIINCGKLQLASPSEKIAVKHIQSKTEYKQLLQSEKFSVINAHFSSFGLDIAKELDIPIVQTLHNQYMWLLEEKHKKTLDRFYKADHYTSMYTSVSSDVAIFSDINLGLDINKMVVISNGIDSSKMKDCPITPLKSHERDIAWMRHILPYTVNPQILPYNRTTDYFVISQMDNEISPAMGHHVSILALSHLKKKLYKEKKPLLIISGRFTNSNFKNWIVKLIDDNDVWENVLFLNEKFENQCSLLKFSDALLHPSLMEGWSTQVAQAVIYDKDIVATFNAGALEIVSNQYIENGFATAVAKLANPPSAYHKIERKGFELEQFLGESNLEFEHSISESLHHLMVGRMLHPKLVHSIPKGYYEDLMTSFIYGGYKKLFELIHLTNNNAEYVRHLFGQSYQL